MTVANRALRSRSRSRSRSRASHKVVQTVNSAPRESTLISKKKKEAAPKHRATPRKRDIVKQKALLLNTTLKSMPLEKFAFVSAILHFSCLVAAGHGIISSDSSLALDRRLITSGFLAYTFDVLTAILLSRSYFYRWTRMDVFVHHIPFMFVGAIWSFKTFKTLYKTSSIDSINDFQQAIRWAMLSCSNECSLAVGGALDLAEKREIRITSTVAGLIYFIICSPIWVFYALRAIYGADTKPIILVVNAAIPMVYAFTQYPLFIKVYWKRFLRLYDDPGGK
ncbi:hypothetical protein TrLO_g9917 [Triparma laevis f. longispina]|uniref:TLC domain-containing protein n=1 Tax=Triparma laevis f. longispina TaxID=1714387 RepID=A0A9W7A252_9STRA|nr:hypothetical protein TrLO_g9917 [Triparma laevis f. longispina]